MKWFFWQKNSLVEAFARTQADDLSSFLRPEVLAEYLAAGAGSPVAGKKKKTGHVSLKKTVARSREAEHRLAEIITRVRQFKAEQSLGIYRKARLHQVFADRLVELGYTADLAKEINQLILLQTP